MRRASLSSVLQRMKVFEWIAVFAILAIALSVRLYKLSTPLGDWHSFRQSDTASVTREFVRGDLDLLRPRYHDISNIQSGELNPDGWRMVEFPLMNGLTALVLRTWPTLELVQTSRMVSILSSLVTLASLMYIARRVWGTKMMLLSGILFAVMPYNIFYNRVILPEPFMVMWSLLTAVAVERWSASFAGRKKWWSVGDAWLILAGVLFAVSLLVKPMAVFFIPFFIGIFWRFRPASFLPWIQAGLVLTVSTLPLILWRDWILQFPTGIPASDWLLNGNGIRLKPAWWRWLFADRIGRLMFGYWGASVLALGFIAGIPAVKKYTDWKAWWSFLDTWMKQEGTLILGALGMVAYLVVFASGNVQHDYYQILLVPILVLAWARGAIWVYEQSSSAVQRFGVSVVLTVMMVISFAFAWYDVSGWYNINNPAFVPAGEAVRRHVPEGALIIAPGFGDTTLLFHTERWGWPIGFEIEDKIADGAQYFISTAYDDEARRLEAQFTVLEKEDAYILIDLQQPVIDDEE